MWSGLWTILTNHHISYVYVLFPVQGVGNILLNLVGCIISECVIARLSTHANRKLIYSIEHPVLSLFQRQMNESLIKWSKIESIDE